MNKTQVLSSFPVAAFQLLVECRQREFLYMHWLARQYQAQAVQSINIHSDCDTPIDTCCFSFLGKLKTAQSLLFLPKKKKKHFRYSCGGKIVQLQRLLAYECIFKTLGGVFFLFFFKEMKYQNQLSLPSVLFVPQYIQPGQSACILPNEQSCLWYRWNYHPLFQLIISHAVPKCQTITQWTCNTPGLSIINYFHLPRFCGMQNGKHHACFHFAPEGEWGMLSLPLVLLYLWSLVPNTLLHCPNIPTSSQHSSARVVLSSVRASVE